MSYTDVFGGNTLYPSDVSYLALALTADTELEWPLEAATGSSLVARIIDVTPTGAYAITLPPADQTGVGQVITIFNVGASTITIKDNSGSTLLSITAGLTYILYLRGNATPAGQWRSTQLGAATAQAQAADLAGPGIVAISSQLGQEQDVTTFNADYTAAVADRSKAFVWTGGLGTLTLTAAGTLGNGWFISVRNEGTGNLTIDCSGADTINGDADLTLRPGDSCLVNTDGSSFYTVGLGQDPVFAFDFTAVDLASAPTTYTLSGAELNRIAYQFTGVLTNNVRVNVPETTQQYWVANDTTGGSFTVSIATASQATPLVVPRGSRGIYYSQGTEVVKADTASIATPIAVADGGTGATTASGARINLGGTATGISVFTAATAADARTAVGAASSGANTFTNKQTFTGSATEIGVKLVTALEKVTISATAATGTIDYDVTTQSNLYYTSNAAANWVVNLRGDASNSLDSLMSTGESVTVTFWVPQGGTAYYNTSVEVDGTTVGVTTEWLGGAPSAGTVSSLNIYQYTAIKTGAATFTVLASLTVFS